MMHVWNSLENEYLVKNTKKHCSRQNDGNTSLHSNKTGIYKQQGSLHKRFQFHYNSITFIRSCRIVIIIIFIIGFIGI